MQPDSALEPDAPAQSSGISVIWNADPAVPGGVNGNVTVTEASFQVEQLELLSDAGDDHTIHSGYQLHWDSNTAPPPDVFPDAPVAVYQKISLDIRPGFQQQQQYAYEIRGTWRNNDGELKPFEIVDTAGLSISIDCSVALRVGGMSSVAIRVDLENALNSVDFANVNEQDGMKLLNSGPLLMNFHNQMTHAFELDH